ncbi:UNVERIFIED_CONTAM: protein FRA10AC1 [Sesamum latifolium]|uniref:Protein FRA10AC1 n=1 Tax=Sesamum latifolium TaxID=2727402 RepID=A0AAW2U2E3_9LAMI
MMGSFGSLKQAIFDKEARKQQYQDHIRGLNAYDRHKKFVNDYGIAEAWKSHKLPNFSMVWQWPRGENFSNDLDGLDEMRNDKFIRTEEDDMNPSWEQRLVKRYYDKLFKEDRSESEDDADVDYGRSKERRKGDKASTSAADDNTKDDNDENFDEFLEGMFP